MNINEIVEKAKRDIDVGRFDKPLKKRRMKTVLVDRGSAGRFFGFVGKSHGSYGVQRKEHKTPEKDRHYEPEDFGLKEKS